MSDFDNISEAIFRNAKMMGSSSRSFKYLNVYIDNDCNIEFIFDKDSNLVDIKRNSYGDKRL